MSERNELRSALKARQPVVFITGDGREWEFPPDLEADAFLSFVEEHGDEIAEGGNLSLPAMTAFFKMTLGSRYGEVRQAGLSFRELNEMAWSLYLTYMGVPQQAGGGDEPGDNPPEG